MNTTIRNTALASILFAAASGAAFAQSSATLSVTGTIKPASCTPTISGGGIVAYGTVSAKTLSSTSATRLPQKSSQLTITCNAATRVGFTLQDNRTGTLNPSASGMLPGDDSNKLGAGKVGGKTIGTYQLNFPQQATADGATVGTIYNQAGSNTWDEPAVGVYSQDASIRTTSWGTTGSKTPGAFTTIVQPFTIDFVIGKTSELPDLTQEVPIDGSATIAIKYL